MLLKKNIYFLMIFFKDLIVYKVYTCRYQLQTCEYEEIDILPTPMYSYRMISKL